MPAIPLFLVLICAFLLSIGCAPAPSAKVSSLGSMGYVAAGAFSETGEFVPKSNSPVFTSGSFYVTDVAGVSLDGIKKVQLKVYNKSNRSLNLEYRFMWFDQNGMEVSTDTDAWHPITIDGKLSRAISSSSKTISAYSFEVYIRKLNYRKP